MCVEFLIYKYTYKKMDWLIIIVVFLLVLSSLMMMASGPNYAPLTPTKEGFSYLNPTTNCVRNIYGDIQCYPYNDYYPYLSSGYYSYGYPYGNYGYGYRGWRGYRGYGRYGGHNRYGGHGSRHGGGHRRH